MCLLAGVVISTVATPAEIPEPPARALAYHREGNAMMEAGDYDKAARMYEAALDLLVDPAEYLYGRATVMSSLQEAQFAAYEEDRDPAHLCEYRETLRAYTRSLEAAVVDRTQPELELARTALDTLEARLRVHADAEVTSVASLCPPRPSSGEPSEPEPDGAREVDDIDMPQGAGELPDPPEIDRAAVRRTPEMVAGAVLTGGGIASIGVMTVGLVGLERSVDTIRALTDEAPTDEIIARERVAYERGQAFRSTAIAAGIVGAAATAAGVALLVVDAKKRGRRVTVAPTPTGISIAGRF